MSSLSRNPRLRNLNSTQDPKASSYAPDVFSDSILRVEDATFPVEVLLSRPRPGDGKSMRWRLGLGA